MTLPTLISIFFLLSTALYLPPEPCQSNQSRAEKKHGNWFGDGRRRSRGKEGPTRIRDNGKIGNGRPGAIVHSDAGKDDGVQEIR